MLAYVFWHWRRAGTDRAEYERRLLAFHSRLNEGRLHGYVGSMAFRAGAAPWLPGAESYEDWYLTEGSHVLDRLNDAAIGGRVRPLHDDVAREAENGTAGLYRLRLGSGDLTRVRWSAWLQRPTGIGYEAFYERMGDMRRQQLAPGGFDLWGRQMTLGPTPEFCVTAERPIDLPEELGAFARPLDPLWADARAPSAK